LKDLEDLPDNTFSIPRNIKGKSNQNGFRIKHELIEDSDGDRA